MLPANTALLLCCSLYVNPAETECSSKMLNGRLTPPSCAAIRSK